MTRLELKLQCEINREVAKISTLSSGNVDKFDCLVGKHRTS